MKKLLCIITISATLISSTAIASINSNTNSNGNLNNNRANSKANSKALSGSISGSSAELNAGYISDTTVNNLTKLPVSGAYAPTAIPTSDCLGSISAGGQGQFAGFSLGFTKQSKPCNIRAYASQFPRYSPIWWGVMCQDKIIKKADKISKGGNCPIKKGWKVERKYPKNNRK